jgi:hypothetical protein
MHSHRLFTAILAACALVLAVSVRHVEAAPATAELEQAALNLNDLGSGFTATSGFIFAGRARFGDAYFAAYIRDVRGSRLSETVMIYLADTRSMPGAEADADALADLVYQALGGIGGPYPQQPPSIGTDTRRFTRSGGNGALARAADAVTWRQGDVFALVMHVVEGGHSADVLPYAEKQQAKLFTAFPPAPISIPAADMPPSTP